MLFRSPAARRQRRPAGRQGQTRRRCAARTLAEAVQRAEESEFLRRILPARLLDAYLAQKRRDAAAWGGAPDPYEYEMQRYFDRV